MHSSSFRSHSLILQRQFNYNHKSHMTGCTDGKYRQRNCHLHFYLIGVKLTWLTSCSNPFQLNSTDHHHTTVDSMSSNQSDWWMGPDYTQHLELISNYFLSLSFSVYVADLLCAVQNCVLITKFSLAQQHLLPTHLQHTVAIRCWGYLPLLLLLLFLLDG